MYYKGVDKGALGEATWGCAHAKPAIVNVFTYAKADKALKTPTY